jgi:inorganic pyrophosphatase
MYNRRNIFFSKTVIIDAVFKRFNLLKSDVMSYSNIPAGKDAPNDIYVIIEIPANAAPIKYEIDKDSDALFVDRFMGTAMFYPANYGYVPNTLSEDGDPLDVLVVTPHPVAAGSVIRCRPVGKLNMEDDGGIDAKLIAVPHEKLSPLYKDVQEYTDLPPLLISQVEHFFAHYKDLEPGKWVKISGWENAAVAKEEVLKAIEAAKK